MKKFLQNLPRLGRGLDTSRNIFGGTLEGLLDNDFEDIFTTTADDTINTTGSEPGVPFVVQKFIEYLKQDCGRWIVGYGRERAYRTQTAHGNNSMH